MLSVDKLSSAPQAERVSKCTDSDKSDLFSGSAAMKAADRAARAETPPTAKGNAALPSAT